MYGKKRYDKVFTRSIGTYFVFGHRKIFLRSSWELIAAIYFCLRGWPINYEDTRVEYDNHTYLSDFRFGKSIWEIKGWIDNRAKLGQKAFENNGYKFRFVSRNEIEKMKIFIISKGVNIISILGKAYDCKRNGAIFRFDATEYLPETLNMAR